MKIKFLQSGGTPMDTAVSLENLDNDWNIVKTLDPAIAKLIVGDGYVDFNFGNKYQAVAPIIRLMQQLALNNGLYDLNQFKQNVASYLPAGTKWNNDSLHSSEIAALVGAYMNKHYGNDVRITPEILQAYKNLVTQALTDHARITSPGDLIDPGAFGKLTATNPYQGHEYWINPGEEIPMDSGATAYIVRGQSTDSNPLSYILQYGDKYYGITPQIYKSSNYRNGTWGGMSSKGILKTHIDNNYNGYFNKELDPNDLRVKAIVSHKKHGSLGNNTEAYPRSNKFGGKLKKIIF